MPKPSDPLRSLNKAFREQSEEFYSNVKVSYKNELTVHRINRGIQEIVDEYEEMVNAIEDANPFVSAKELELLRATRWYCCSDISDELMVAYYRRRSTKGEG
jgi:hypothetical protein